MSYKLIAVRVLRADGTLEYVAAHAEARDYGAIVIFDKPVTISTGDAVVQLGTLELAGDDDDDDDEGEYRADFRAPRCLS